MNTYVTADMQIDIAAFLFGDDIFNLNSSKTPHGV